MKRFAIMSDTACDLPVALQKKYDIEVISAHLTLPDKSEIDVHIDWNGTGIGLCEVHRHALTSANAGDILLALFL